MKVVDIALNKLREAPWNPNKMDESMLSRLTESIKRYGLLENLVVHPTPDGEYEVLSGNQRLRILRDAGFRQATCVVVDLSQADSRLLAQALNRIRGEDDLGLRAELVGKVLHTLPVEAVAAVLPETINSLKAMSSMGQDTMAAYIQNWQQAKAARLKHLQFQLTNSQLVVVQRALALILQRADHAQPENPNARSNALYILAKAYLEKEGEA
jgi:ParB family chromosome partitioning protein